MGRLLDRRLRMMSLLCKVLKGIKFAAGIEPLLILAVTASSLSIVFWSIGADQPVAEVHPGGAVCGDLTPACRPAIV